MKAMLEPRIVAVRTHGAAFWVHGMLAFSDRMSPSSQGCLITLAIFWNPRRYRYRSAGSAWPRLHIVGLTQVFYDPGIREPT